MNEGAELATAGLIVAFVAVLLVASHFFIESQSAKQLAKPSMDLKITTHVIASWLWPGCGSGQPTSLVTVQTVFSWFKPNRRREIRDDRKHLKARARRLLKSYLTADSPRKQRYYEVVAGAAAACQPDFSDPNLENAQLSQATAEAALKIVKLREHQRIADNDQVAALITDAYATVAVAYRRASAAYATDEEMQKLGTAAVHLLTMAMSYMAAQTDEAAQK
jgi:hypothetical protein